jgi:tRNA(His) guanylyltransferase
MKDALGDRMKDQYENRTRYSLPRRTYTIMRIDGKAFHTYTADYEKPFDHNLIRDMDRAAKDMLQDLMGVQFCYIQSDELSFLLTDFTKPGTQAWFDGNLQKMCSVGASMYTAYFNQYRSKLEPPAMFDCRIFTIPDRTEVENYFIWRQQDATRNSINQVARSLYSHKELQDLRRADIQELIFQKGVNWDTYPVHLKRGRVVKKVTSYVDHPMGTDELTEWQTDNEIPIFTCDREYLRKLIPQYP